MLSEETVDFLRERCRASRELYDQGGLIYNYKFGYDFAHSAVVHRYKLHKNIAAKFLEPEEINKIAVFFQKASINYNFDTAIPSEKAKKIAGEFLLNCYRDFNDTYAFLAGFNNSGSGIVMKIIFLADNNFHALELDWSID